MSKAKMMLLKSEFTQEFPNDSVCVKINEQIAAEDIVSVESRRYFPNEEFPVLVTVWYRN